MAEVPEAVGGPTLGGTGAPGVTVVAVPSGWPGVATVPPSMMAFYIKGAKVLSA